MGWQWNRFGFHKEAEQRFAFLPKRAAHTAASFVPQDEWDFNVIWLAGKSPLKCER